MDDWTQTCLGSLFPSGLVESPHPVTQRAVAALERRPARRVPSARRPPAARGPLSLQGGSITSAGHKKIRYPGSQMSPLGWLPKAAKKNIINNSNDSDGARNNTYSILIGMAPQFHGSGRESRSQRGGIEKPSMGREFDAPWARSQACSRVVGIEREKGLAGPQGEPGVRRGF